MIQSDIHTYVSAAQLAQSLYILHFSKISEGLTDCIPSEILFIIINILLFYFGWA